MKKANSPTLANSGSDTTARCILPETDIPPDDANALRRSVVRPVVDSAPSEKPADVSRSWIMAVAEVNAPDRIHETAMLTQAR